MLDVLDDFSAVSPVTATDRRDRGPGIHCGFAAPPGQARVFAAGRHHGGHHFLYGCAGEVRRILHDTSIYQSIATSLATQPPFSTTLSIPNTAQNPLTLAQGFVAVQSNHEHLRD